MHNISRKYSLHHSETARAFNVSQSLSHWRAKFIFTANLMSLLTDDGTDYVLASVRRIKD